MMEIVPYIPEYWAEIEKIHDAARAQELALAKMPEAFLPLCIAAEREDLFGYSLYVGKIGERIVHGRMPGNEAFRVTVWELATE